jgi:hypothetical protein
MPDLTPEEQYQKEYDEAAALLDSAAAGTKPEVITDPVIKTGEPAVKTDPATVDPLAEVRAELEKTQKALKDTQAWGTKNAQRIAEIERERQQQQRDATKPAILDANPDLADAIRYVAGDPAPQQQAQDTQQKWMDAVSTAHPGIFDMSIDPELEKAILKRSVELGNEWNNPLVAIREITAEKLAFTEQQVGKRFAAAAATVARKSAMSVPGAGGGSAGNRTAPDVDLEAVQRIQNMSDADFEKEVRRVKGY